MAPIDARKKLEQMRRQKNKNQPTNNGKVKDLRQLIAKKKPTKGNNVSPLKSGVRDQRETNSRLASRRNLSQTRDNRVSSRTDRSVPNRSQTNNNKSNNNNGGNINNKTRNKQPQQQYYVPPHIQQQQPQPQPTYIIASAAQPQSRLAMDSVPGAQGASILISNLNPPITQSDIIELFGDIGVMTSVNMINQTTALVTYQNSSDAVRAVKVYHNRLLDGQPMSVNMMPNTANGSNVRSRIG